MIHCKVAAYVVSPVAWGVTALLLLMVNLLRACSFACRKLSQTTQTVQSSPRTKLSA